MSEYKIPNTIKVMFVADVLLFVTGVSLDYGLITATSVVIAVILSVAVSIIEAINDALDNIISLELKNNK